MSNVDFAIEKVKRVRYYVEPSGAYATNGSGSVSYSDIRTTSAEMTLTQEFLENETMMQLIDAASPKIRSRRRCAFKMGSYLSSHNVVVSGATNPVPHAEARLLGAVMGGTLYTTGSEVGAVVDAGTFSEGSIDDKIPGTAVALIDPATGRLECSRVKSDGGTSGDIYLEHELPFTPVSGAPIYGGTHCHFTDDPATSLQFYTQGQHQSDTWVLTGLQGGFGMTFANGELVKLDFDFQGANWNSGSADLIQPASFSSADPVPVVNSRVLLYPLDTSGASADYISIDASAWELTPNISYVDITTPGGVNNILRKRRSRSVPVAAGTITTYFHNRNYFQNRDLDTRYGLAIQVGHEPGKTVYISVPYIQILDVSRVDASEVAGVQISWEALDNKDGTGANREAVKSPYSIHFF